jgi:hypothetical protein
MALQAEEEKNIKDNTTNLNIILKKYLNYIQYLNNNIIYILLLIASIILPYFSYTLLYSNIGII